MGSHGPSHARHSLRRLHVSALLTLLALLATGCGGDGGGDGDTGPEVKPAIALMVNPTSVSIEQGRGDVVTVSVVRSGGYTGTVSFGVSGAPAGVTASVRDVTTNGPATTATLDVVVGSAVSTGTYDVVVTAMGSGVTAVSATIALTVTEEIIPIELAVDPTSAVVEQGTSAQVTATVTRLGGIVSPVPSFSTTGAPAGVTTSFSQPVDAGTTVTSTLTLDVGPQADAGTYDLTVEATSQGVATVTEQFELTVTAAPSFTLGLASADLSVDQGDEGDVQVSLDRTNFDGPVTLTLEGPNPVLPPEVLAGPLPEGVTGSFEPNPATGDAATLTVMIDGAVPAGMHALTVRASAEGLEDRTASFQLTVTEVAQPAPVRFDPTEIAMGAAHGCRLDATGRAICWGSDFAGQLGDDGALAAKATPVFVAGGHTFGWITVGGSHSCGLDAAGQAWCWGSDLNGQLGDDAAFVKMPTPVAVGGGHVFTGLAAGGDNTCGLTAEGQAWCWGYDFYSQLGDGPPNQNQPLPVAVSGDHEFAAITVGSVQICGLDVTGKAWCWGNDGLGELGDGPPIQNRNVPQPVSGNRTFLQIAASARHACALDEQGDAWCWGADYGGQLGDGAGSPDVCGSQGCSLGPVAVSGGLVFETLFEGGDHACGVVAGGTAYCWGMDDMGQLGNGPGAPDLCGGLACSVAPVAVGGGHLFQEMDGTGWNTCGVDLDGDAWCWGDDSAEQLGDGPGLTDRHLPTRVLDPS